MAWTTRPSITQLLNLERTDGWSECVGVGAILCPVAQSHAQDARKNRSGTTGISDIKYHGYPRTFTGRNHQL